QGEQRLHAAVTQGLQHIEIVRQGSGRELTGRRLDARPLNRKSMGILVQGSEQIKDADKSFVMFAGPVGTITIFYMPGYLLPGPPVIGIVAPFDLVRRGRRSPKKFFRELSVGHADCCPMIARTMATTISTRTSTTTAPIGPM